MFSIDSIIESVAVWAREILGSAEIVAAKEDFFARAGKVFPEDSFFDVRMNYFTHYFVTQNRFARLGSTTPIEAYVRSQALQQRSPEEQTVLRCIARARHSLFQVNKHSDDEMTLTDLFVDKSKYVIKSKSGESFRAFAKKDLFQGIVYPVESMEEGFIANGVIMHPATAEKILRKRIKELRKLAVKDPDVFNLKRQDEWLIELAAQNLRLLRHPHVTPKTIYSTPSKETLKSR